jgi:hypothetical protein
MRRFIFAFVLFFAACITAAHAKPQWLTLPPTPKLPAHGKSGYAPVNGIKIWYATLATARR